MKKILIVLCLLIFGLQGICSQADEKRIIGKQGVSRGIMVYIPKHEDNAKMKQAFGEWTKATNGKITFTDFLGGGGYTITITTIDSTFGEIKYSYCHCDPNFIVSVGDYVKKGQIIGKVGPKNVYGVLRQ